MWGHRWRLERVDCFEPRSRKGSRTAIIVKAIPLEMIGQDFLTLWTLKTQEKYCLLADRRPDTLKWHFKVPGDQGSVMILGGYEDGILIGYVVVRTDTDRYNGLRKCIIPDMLVRNDNPEVIRALLIACYRHAIREGSDVLEVQGFPPQLRAVFSELRPYFSKISGMSLLFQGG